MTKEECDLLLGFIDGPSIYKWAGTIVVDMTLKTLTTAIERSIEARLTSSLSEVKGFTAVQMLDDNSLLLLRNGDKLMCLKSKCEDEDFDTETYGQTLFRALDNDGLLHEFLPQPIVDEYKRLSDIIMADRIARHEENNRKRDRDELERLIKKRENGLI